jgi:hypothetical protein
MADILDAKQEVNIQDEDNSKKVNVDNRTTTANGMNTLPLGEYRTTLPTLTNTQVAPIQLTSDGRLRSFPQNEASTPIYTIIRDKNTSTNQLSVDSAGRISTTSYSINTNAVSQYNSVDAGVTFPLTILTYTVPTGHTLYITNFHLQSIGGNTVAEIEIDGTLKGLYYNPSTAGLQQYEFGPTSPLIVQAGEVVTIVAGSGSSSNKTYYASFNGYETS